MRRPIDSASISRWTEGLASWTRAVRDFQPAFVAYYKRVTSEIENIEDEEYLDFHSLAARGRALNLHGDVSTENISGLAAMLLENLQEVMVCQHPGVAANSFASIFTVSHVGLPESTRNMLCVYLLTRAPSLTLYFEAVADFAIEIAEQGTEAEPVAARALSALWLLVVRTLMNPLSLDARTVLCESSTMVSAFARAALRAQVHLDIDCTDEPAAQLSKVIDAFSPSPFWTSFMSLTNFRAVVISCVADMLSARGDEIRRITSMAETLHRLLLLAINSTQFSLQLSNNSLLVPKLLTFLADMGRIPDADWAFHNVNWIRESLNRSDQTCLFSTDQSLPLSATTIITGHAIMAMHLLGRHTYGAETIRAHGPLMLATLRRLVDLHTEALLKKFNLWHVVLSIVPTCALGTPTSAVDTSIGNPRRFKHYNVLLRCSYCSRVAVGSRQLKICGECHLVRYCGRECQQKDWLRSHNLVCMSFSPTGGDGSKIKVQT